MRLDAATCSEVEQILSELPDLSDELIDPMAALEQLAREIGNGPDSAARREMVEELRAAMREVGL